LLTKFIPPTKHIKEFLKSLAFLEEKIINTFSKIIKSYLTAEELRISSIASAMTSIYRNRNGSKTKHSDADYKVIQRFLDKIEISTLKDILKRIISEKAPFIIIDPTEIIRKEAYKTPYVGILSDGKTRGFLLISASIPYKGRALPCFYNIYSSKTIKEESSSRNIEHYKVIAELKDLVGDKPLVFDREFSYEELLTCMIELDMRWVIRLNTGNRVTITDSEGNKITLSIAIKEKKIWKDVYYKGKVKVNLVGFWKMGMKDPIYVITNMEPDEALKIYLSRMKIDESYRDEKNMLKIKKVMNKDRDNLEKMIGIALISYLIGLLVGEELRDLAYKGREWLRYSGLFVLLRKAGEISNEKKELAVKRALEVLRTLVGIEEETARSP